LASWRSGSVIRPPEMAGLACATALCGAAGRSQPPKARNPAKSRFHPSIGPRQLRPPGAAARSLFMELDLDESSLAIGRIERALSRIEKALAERAQRPAPSPAASPPESSALKAEVAAVIDELDRLIAEAKHG